jgi:soluble lytic murein transglycosylase-like protein
MASTVSVVALSCWMSVAQHYGLPQDLLRAIAQVESGNNAYAVHRNPNGTVDIGLMQINSRWLPALAQIGIGIHELFEPCVSIAVGAWILSEQVARYGYSWEAIGAYNAGPYDARSHGRKLSQYRLYALRVIRVWRAWVRARGENAYR